MIAVDTPVWGQQYVEWREPGEKPTPERHWHRNQTCPQPGQVRWAYRPAIGAPRYNKPFWMLYQPSPWPFSEETDQSHELDACAVIECEATDHLQAVWKQDKRGRLRAEFPESVRVTRAMEASGENFALQPDVAHQGWVEVRCLRVVPLAQIPLHFAPSRRGDIPDQLPAACSKHSYFAETSRLTYTMFQDDEASEWWVSTKAEPPRLVLYCFEVGREDFQICNAILPLPEPD